jgi:hypothetical protein
VHVRYMKRDVVRSYTILCRREEKRRDEKKTKAAREIGSEGGVLRGRPGRGGGSSGYLMNEQAAI